MTITTLLFDMDSTLIEIDETTFSKNYFKLLHQKYFSDFDLSYFYDGLTDITKTVMLSKNSKEYNFETFQKEIAKRFKRTPEEVLINLMSFYNSDYDKLKPFIKPMNDVDALMDKCFEAGYEVIIATTPIFPEIAIQKRLEWGGLGDYNFNLITHAENMRYSKPREEYYYEILSKLNKNANECIMIGNEFIGDILSPTRIGMKTFYCPVPSMTEELFDSPELKRFVKIKPTYQGRIQDFSKLLDNGQLNK